MTEDLSTFKRFLSGSASCADSLLLEGSTAAIVRAVRPVAFTFVELELGVGLGVLEGRIWGVVGAPGCGVAEAESFEGVSLAFSSFRIEFCNDTGRGCLAGRALLSALCEGVPEDGGGGGGRILSKQISFNA